MNEVLKNIIGFGLAIIFLIGCLWLSQGSSRGIGTGIGDHWRTEARKKKEQERKKKKEQSNE